MTLYRSGVRLQQEMAGTSMPEQSAALWALGQEGFVIQIGDRRVVIDPYLSDSIYETAGEPWVRKFPPPITPEQLPELDAVLCSHHHDDHMDIKTLLPLRQRERTKFVIPRAHEQRLKEWRFHTEQLVGVNHMETVNINGIEIKALAAKHDNFEQDDAGYHYYLGFVIKYAGMVIYHAGDTIGFPELVDWLRDEQVDIALIPINGRDFTRTSKGIVGNCNYREAADLAVAIGADLVIPMHWGLFPHNDENPAYFVDYIYTHYPQQKFHLMTTGERFIYQKF